MRINKNKQAYTLAEIMVVVLVLSIIFAAFAPIFTKRKLTDYSSKYAVWEYTGDTSYDAYYYQGDPTYTGELFFGITPAGKDSVTSVLLPLSKLVIRSGEVTSSEQVQKQIQFRYGRSSTNDKGSFAGVWFMDGKNALLGGKYRTLDTTATGATGNSAIGYEALTNLTTGSYNTALGYYALQSTTTGKYNVGVGYYAGYSTGTSTNGNTLLGAFAGQSHSGGANTFIGYKAGQNSGSGTYNTVIGAFAGDSINGATGNVAIGYNALGALSSGTRNIALGTNALANLQSGDNNVAIGAGACRNITKSSNKTCIGYNSGPQSGTESYKYLNAKGVNPLSSSDTVPRTYIGSKPSNFGGDAVLEIHNLDSKLTGTTRLSGYAYNNTTTIVNGNLIIKGRPYFTVGSSLYHFHDRNFGDNTSKEIGYYGYGTNSSYSETTYYAKCASSLTSYSWGSCINLNTTSDRRLKNVGSRFTAGLDEINKLKVYNFTFKNDPDKKPQVGVMAQDLKKIFPNAVFEDENGYLKIRWDEMFYAAINAIKELDKKIVAIAKRVTNVETQIAELEKENTSLKEQVDSIALRINKLKEQ